MNLPPSTAKRTYYSNPQVALMMRGARFEALLARNVTKLPLLLYWRSKDDRILKGLHGKIPSLMGTVGMVVGSKESHLSASVNAPRRSETTSSTLFPS